MGTIFHIVDKDVWNEARTKGLYEPESISEEGFIHCSTKSTVIEVAHKFFKGRDNLLLVCINPELVKSEIRYEMGICGEEGPFPHIYGALNMDAVTAVVDLLCGPDGRFYLPDELAER